MSLVDYQSSSDDEEKTIPVAQGSKIDPLKNLKRKEPVRFSVPALKEDEEDEDVPSKKPKNTSISGLLGMLPAPKFSTNMLVPDVLTRKKKPELHTSVAKTLQSRAQTPVTKSVPISNVEETDENEDHCTTNFFSLESYAAHTVPFPSSYRVGGASNSRGMRKFPSRATHSTPTIEVAPSNFKLIPVETTASAVSYHLNRPAFPDNNIDINELAVKTVREITGSHSNVKQLDEKYYTTLDEYEPPEFNILEDENFKKFQGKNRSGLEDLKHIIDVSVDSQLVNRTEWLTKPLTEEKSFSHSRKKNNMPTQQQKRKHQITYLAFQAKEREVDLKNQWSQNRLTKRETQAKYGF